LKAQLTEWSPKILPVFFTFLLFYFKNVIFTFVAVAHFYFNVVDEWDKRPQ